VDRHVTEPTTVVFAGGDETELPVPLPDVVRHASLSIAADSGGDAMLRHGIVPDVVVGDLDSISAAALRWAESEGATIVRHPVDKDATDLELALALAVERGARHIALLGGTGGRLDHLVANAALVAAYDAATITWWTDHSTVLPCRPGLPREVVGAVDDLVSLVPMGGDAAGIVTTGLRWELDGAVLRAGSTRGVSNRMVRPRAQVRVASGTLLIMHERNPS